MKSFGQSMREYTGLEQAEKEKQEGIWLTEAYLETVLVELSSTAVHLVVLDVYYVHILNNCRSREQ